MANFCTSTLPKDYLKLVQDMEAQLKDMFIFTKQIFMLMTEDGWDMLM